MTTKSLEKNLKALGLSPSHVWVYLTSLESGPASASSLARKAGVPRSSCYGLLDNLAKLGLISVVKGETKKIFIPSPPHKLKELLEERQKDLDESLAVLKKELINDKIAFISHDSLVGVIIEDATLAASERAQFETLWNFYLRKTN